MAEKILSQLINLTRKYNQLMNDNKELKKQLDAKKAQPYSKVKKQPKIGNLDLVYDGNTGLWHTYAVYKDDE